MKRKKKITVKDLADWGVNRYKINDVKLVNIIKAMNTLKELLDEFCSPFESSDRK